jgi:ABC-type glutathione transport system ATPase component
MTHNDNIDNINNNVPLLEARNVGRSFPVRGTGGLFRARQLQQAVDGVSLSIAPGETLALVGESGSGKTTLGRMLLGLTPPTTGSVCYRGQDIGQLSGAGHARFRSAVQVVFQDTGGSLNPRHTIAQSIALPLRYNRGMDADAAAREADALLDQVRLPPAHFRHRLPHELSGGQRQRVGIARALASQPEVVIADEPVSALDVSVRAQVLRLMYELQRARGLAFLFITHDLGVVRAFADRVAVMYQGRLVEQGTADEVLDAPQHPYTQRLLAATPVPDPRRQRMEPLHG